MRQVFVAALVGLLLVLASGPTRASEIEGFVSRTAIQPVRPTLVTLETMEVRYRVFFDRSEIEAVFTLRNTGPATTVVMGLAEWRIDEEEPVRPADMHDFRAFVDGLEVPVRRDPDLVSEPPSDAIAWHVWEVAFAVGQTRQVRYTCWSDMEFIEIGRATAYSLWRAWHGSIGRARIVFELVSYFPYHVDYDIMDPRYRFEGDNVVWEGHDFELEPRCVWLGLYADRLLDSVRDTTPGWGPTYHLATKWEKLSQAGSYKELLAEVEAHRRDEGMKVNPFLAPLYEARALNGLGRTQDAVRNWHSILELTLPPDDMWWLHPAQDEAFYHLARYYHATGDQDRVVELYERLKRRRPPYGRFWWRPLVLLRWMESLLPPELAGGEPPTVEALLLPEEPPSYNNGCRSYSLRYHARDPDGDLIRVEWAIWYAWGDPEHTINKGRSAFGPGHEHDSSAQVWVRPCERVWYRVEVVDLRGNRGSTGILEYVPPDYVPPAAPAARGDGPAAVEPPRRSAWPLVGGGMLAAALGALIFAWRRRRARSLRAGAGPGA